MKKARIIAAMVAAIVAAVLIPYVCIEWSKQGCEIESLIAAIAFYGVSIAGIWAIVDITIKEREQ